MVPTSRDYGNGFWSRDPRFESLHPSMYFVYVLQSEKSARFYVGQTGNIGRRLEIHNLGLNRSTKAERPWKLVYTEEFETRGGARSRENQIKAMKSRKFIENLNQGVVPTSRDYGNGFWSRDPRFESLHPSMYFVYVLQSEKSARFYVGQTGNIGRRLEIHNLGLNRSTKAERPWKLVYTEEFETRGGARSRENQIKAMKSRKFIENLISGCGPD